MPPTSANPLPRDDRSPPLCPHPHPSRRARVCVTAMSVHTIPQRLIPQLRLFPKITFSTPSFLPLHHALDNHGEMSLSSLSTAALSLMKGAKTTTTVTTEKTTMMMMQTTCRIPRRSSANSSPVEPNLKMTSHLGHPARTSAPRVSCLVSRSCLPHRVVKETTWSWPPSR